MEKQNQNVYIASLPRSGSTILGLMLNQHPEIVHIGESSYWGKFNDLPNKCSCGKGLSCSFILDIYEKVKKDKDVNSIYKACSAIDKLREPKKIPHTLSLPDSNTKVLSKEKLEEEILKACRGLEKIADLYRKKTGKPIVVDNTKYPLIAEELLKRKNWKVILLLRDPRGIAFANKKAGARKNVPRPVKEKISLFIDFAKKAQVLNSSDRVLLIRYEDLCNNAEKILKLICKFLNIPFEKDMLNFYKDRGHILAGNRLLFKDMPEKELKEDKSWESGLDIKEQSLIKENKTLVDLYRQFNYFL